MPRQIRVLATFVVLAGAALAGVLLAIGDPGGSSEESSTARWTASAAAASVHGPLTFPVAEPPGVIDVSFHVVSGLGAVGLFAASGEPTIAVCPAAPVACRRFLPTSTALSAGGAAPARPTLLGVPGEPSTRRLSDAARRYWMTVGFTTARPEWFPS